MSPANDTTGPIFSPRDAFQIDQKMDDGKPFTGHVRGRDASGLPTDCISSANYIKSDSTLQCRFEFVIGRY